MIFRYTCFYPLQTSSLLIFLSLKDRNYKSWRGYFSTCFNRLMPGFPLHTRNWGLGPSSAQPGSSALHSRASHSGQKWKKDLQQAGVVGSKASAAHSSEGFSSSTANTTLWSTPGMYENATVTSAADTTHSLRL